MAVYSVFSFISGRLVVRLGLDNLIGIGSVVGAISGVFMLGLALAGINTLWAIMAPMLGVMISLSFMLPTATAGAMSPFGDMAGSAMANLGFIQTCVSASISAIVGLAFDGTQIPMVVAIAVMCVALLLAYVMLIRPLQAANAGP